MALSGDAHGDRRAVPGGQKVRLPYISSTRRTAVVVGGRAHALPDRARACGTVSNRRVIRRGP
jgi:hypothetical protein